MQGKSGSSEENAGGCLSLQALGGYDHTHSARAPPVSHLGWWPVLCLIVITFVKMCPVDPLWVYDYIPSVWKTTAFFDVPQSDTLPFPTPPATQSSSRPCHVPGRPDLFCWLCKSAERHRVQRGLGMPLISIVHRCHCWMNLLPLPKFFSKWS